MDLIARQQALNSMVDSGATVFMDEKWVQMEQCPGELALECIVRDFPSSGPRAPSLRSISLRYLVDRTGVRLHWVRVFQEQ